MTSIIIAICIIMINSARCQKYNESNSKYLFERYKKNYDRNYSDEYAEKNAFMIFIRHLNKVSRLNRKFPSNFNITGVKSYNLNRYADQDSAELLQRYAVTVQPYDYAKNAKHHELNYIRSKQLKNVEDANLYDLDETEGLYDKFKTKYKKEYRHFRPRQISYYRFYKTLVELNNKKITGEDVALDNKADVIKEPGQYYFDE